MDKHKKHVQDGSVSHPPVWELRPTLPTSLPRNLHSPPNPVLILTSSIVCEKRIKRSREFTNVPPCSTEEDGRVPTLPKASIPRNCDPNTEFLPILHSKGGDGEVVKQSSRWREGNSLQQPQMNSSQSSPAVFR